MPIPGIASTVLLNVILAWNEAFWTLNLTTIDAAPLTQFIASFSAPPSSWSYAIFNSGRWPHAAVIGSSVVACWLIGT